MTRPGGLTAGAEGERKFPVLTSCRADAMTRAMRARIPRRLSTQPYRSRRPSRNGRRPRSGSTRGAPRSPRPHPDGRGARRVATAAVTWIFPAHSHDHRMDREPDAIRKPDESRAVAVPARWQDTCDWASTPLRVHPDVAVRAPDGRRPLSGFARADDRLVGPRSRPRLQRGVHPDPGRGASGGLRASRQGRLGQGLGDPRPDADPRARRGQRRARRSAARADPATGGQRGV